MSIRLTQYGFDLDGQLSDEWGFSPNGKWAHIRTKRTLNFSYVLDQVKTDKTLDLNSEEIKEVSLELVARGCPEWVSGWYCLELDPDANKLELGYYLEKVFERSKEGDFGYSNLFLRYAPVDKSDYEGEEYDDDWDDGYWEGAPEPIRLTKREFLNQNSAGLLGIPTEEYLGNQRKFNSILYAKYRFLEGGQVSEKTESKWGLSAIEDFQDPEREDDGTLQWWVEERAKSFGITVEEYQERREELNAPLFARFAEMFGEDALDKLNQLTGNSSDDSKDKEPSLKDDDLPKV